MKTTIVRNGPDDRPGDADHRLLVADRDVAPGEDGEQLAIGPEVAPVMPLGPAGLQHDGDPRVGAPCRFRRE